jgi:hypothetical protein
MPNPEPAPPPQQGPVIPPGANIPASSLYSTGSTPFIGTNLDTPSSPRSAPGPLPGQMMQDFAPNPSLSLGWGGGGGMAPVLKFNGYGDFAGFLYHSPHTVVYEDDLYPTALHLFEARKFLDHRPDLAEQIRRCERVEEITAISAQQEMFARRDWGNVALRMVSNHVSHCACFGLTCADCRGWML